MNGASAFEGPVSIFVPIRTARGLLIEPEIGFDRAWNDEKVQGLQRTDSYTLFRTTLGVHYVVARSGDSHLYVGTRAGLETLSFRVVEEDAPGSYVTIAYRRVDTALGGSIGGELWLSRHLSVGAEAKLRWVIFGDPSNVAVVDGYYYEDYVSASGYTLATHTLVLARLWF